MGDCLGSGDADGLAAFGAADAAAAGFFGDAESLAAGAGEAELSHGDGEGAGVFGLEELGGHVVHGVLFGLGFAFLGRLAGGAELGAAEQASQAEAATTGFAGPGHAW